MMKVSFSAKWDAVAGLKLIFGTNYRFLIRVHPRLSVV
jgi:hypothetical protein